MAQASEAPRDFGTEAAFGSRRSSTHTETTTGGALLEAVLGIAAVVLGILGLVGIIPLTLASIATIVLGVAFVFAGGALASRYTHLLRETSGGRVDTTDFGGGLALEVLGGFAGIVLGILALIGIHAMTLMAASVIAFGVTLLFSSGSLSRISSMEVARTGVGDEAMVVAREAVMATSGLQLLVGIGVSALGVLALVGKSPQDLILVALIAVGGAFLFAGSVFGGRLLSLIQ